MRTRGKRGRAQLHELFGLDIAKGSAGELRTQLYIAKEIDVIGTEEMTELVQEAKEIGRMLRGLSNARSKQVQDESIPDPEYLNTQGTKEAI